MKNIIAVAAISITSAFVAIFIYDQFIHPKTIIIQENSPVVLTSEKELLLSKRFAERFSSSTPTNFIKAANECRQAVVSVRALSNAGNIIFNKETSSSSGSGVIVSSDGYIITNDHLIKDADLIQITLEDNRKYEAKLIGTDPMTDIALLKIEAEQLPKIIFGNSDSLQVGEWVMAIGNPFKLQSSVTAGIVSAKARNINILEGSDIEAFIQTDAAVNVGNSGGALVNTLGELVGINTAILTRTGNFEGFSFAVPSNLVQKVMIDIQEFGAVQRGYLGVTATNVTDEIAKLLDLKDRKGVFVESIRQGSAADDSNIKKNDVILAINNNQILNTPSFMEHLASYRPGDEISLNIWRNQSLIEIKTTLRNHINTTSFVAIRRDKILQKLGMEVRDLDQSEIKRLGTSGCKVISVSKGSIIDLTNMESGYVITHLGKSAITNSSDFISQLEKSSGLMEVKGIYDDYPGIFPYRFEIPQ